MRNVRPKILCRNVKIQEGSIGRRRKVEARVNVYGTVRNPVLDGVVGNAFIHSNGNPESEGKTIQVNFERLGALNKTVKIMTKMRKIEEP